MATLDSSGIATQRQPITWYLLWLLCAPFAFLGLWYATDVGFGYDSHAYWAATQHMDHLYDAPALSRDAYLYSPLFAQIIWPLTRLPWPVFGVLWSLAMAVAFYWLLRPLSPRWFLPSCVAVLPEIVTGNVYALMAVALVLGATWGAPWTFLGFTKIVPGGLGLVWLSLTRQWRELGKGGCLAAVLTGLSIVLSPSAWQQWVGFLLDGSTPTEHSINSPLLGEVLISSGVLAVVVGALTQRAWLLAVAAIFVSPTIGLNTFTLLAAVPRLRAMTPGDNASSASVHSRERHQKSWAHDE